MFFLPYDLLGEYVFCCFGKNMLISSAFGGREMIKRIFSTVATVAIVLILGARLGVWRELGVSLASQTAPAIFFGRTDK